ncbi:hypothetical protein [Sphingomonas sp.]|uniref:hypothetical protein n=1 Tax=Sphingomonas sp. TaxID=28214 RepID=UPI002DD65EFA|nr:hypothetical protein [Sphingomonas sp.]
MASRCAGIAVALALLAGCGGVERDEDGAVPASGVKISGLGAGEVAAPRNLPPFAPVYPGASVTSTVLNAPEPDKGMMVLSVPSANGAAIIEFYKRRGAAAGLKLGMETAAGAGRIIAMNESGETTGDTPRALQVTVVPSDAGASTVTVIYAGGQ